MLKFSRKQDYAILAVSHLSAADVELPVSARVLAEASGIPAAVLANILKDLCRAGLVTSLRGMRGGYQLAMPAHQLSVGHLLRALEGPRRLVECVVLPGDDGEEQSCDLIAECPARTPLRRLHDRIQGVLDEVSFDQLSTAPAAVPAGVAGAPERVSGPFPLTGDPDGEGQAPTPSVERKQP